MFRWLAKRSRATRAAMCATQTAMRIEAATPPERAAAVVAAIHLCLSFRQADEGVLLSMQVENPKGLGPEDAYALYWELEGLLLASKQKNKAAQQRMQQVLGSDGASRFAKQMEMVELGINLLLVRLSEAFRPENREHIRKIAHALFVSAGEVDGAIRGMKAADAATGNAKHEDFYAFLRDSAYHYSLSYSV